MEDVITVQRKINNVKDGLVVVSVRPKPKLRPKLRSKTAETVRPKLRWNLPNHRIGKKRRFWLISRNFSKILNITELNWYFIMLLLESRLNHKINSVIWCKMVLFLMYPNFLRKFTKFLRNLWPEIRPKLRPKLRWIWPKLRFRPNLILGRFGRSLLWLINSWNSVKVYLERKWAKSMKTHHFFV